MAGNTNYTMYTDDPADMVARETALYKPKESSRTILDNKLGITERNTFTENNSSPVGAGGLGETSLDLDKNKSLKEEGMSRGMANFQAGAGIGLGLLSFLENRKTSKLQREALRHDIDTAKEHRANRQALGASFSAGLASGLAKPPAPAGNSGGGTK